jgi:hypothetical protein
MKAKNKITAKKKASEMKKLRNFILTLLDRKKWPWDPVLSNLLDQIDSRLFRMRGDR